MLFKAIAFTLVYTTLSYSVNEFSNKFCDNSSMDQMIDRVFQTPTTIYVIRNSMVYPITRKEMPLVRGTAEFWTQKTEAFDVKHLFLGTDLNDFQTGFTITLDSNKSYIRDSKYKSIYQIYYLTFIFSQNNYYVFKQLFNNSFVLADKRDIPLIIQNQGSIWDVFNIEGPVYLSVYQILKISNTESKYIFTLILISKNKMNFYYLHQNFGQVLLAAQLFPNKSQSLKIDTKHNKYSEHHIRGIVTTNIPNVVLKSDEERFMVSLDHIENLSESPRISIWEAFDCDYIHDVLPQMEEIYSTGKTWGTIPTVLTTIIKPKQISSYWLTIISLTLIFLVLCFIIFVPLLAFRQINNKSNETYLSKTEKSIERHKTLSAFK